MMQKAIENFINIQSMLEKPLDKIEDEIHDVEKTAIRKRREEQYKDWRMLNKKR